MLTQLLSLTKDPNFQLQLQTIQQMLANQAALLQLLSNGAMNMTPMGMGPMSMGSTGTTGSMNMGTNASGMSGMMMM
jgi:hypothetical protein